MHRLALLCLGLACAAQDPPTPVPRVFLRDFRRFAGARLLSDAITWAFQIERRHLVMPDSLKRATGQFDVEQDKRDDFRRELEEKYALVYHFETRSEDAFVFRLPGRPGPELKESAETARFFQGRSVSSSTYHWVVCRPCRFDEIPAALGRSLDAECRDETGLRGSFEFTIKWPIGDLDAMAAEFREKLGIEVRREPKPVQVLVIDAATVPASERPPEPPAPRWPCEPSPAVRAALDALPRMEDYSLAREQRMAPRWELARLYPADPFVQMELQDAIAPWFHLAADWDRALRAYAGLGDAIWGPFLQARLLAAAGRDPSQALNRVLEFAQDFPWAHLELARQPGARAGEHLAAFRKACPESLLALPLMDPVDPTLAYRASWRFDRASIQVMPHIWRLSLRNGGDVRRAVTLYRAQGRFTNPDWIAAVRSGYDLMRDAAALSAFENAVLAQAPTSAAAYRIARDRWYAANSFPERDEKRQQAWTEALISAYRDWKKAFPKLPEVDRDRWTALRDMPWVSAAEKLDAVRSLYAAAALHPEYGGAVPPIALEYAALLKGGELAPALIEQSLKQAEQQERYRPGGAQPANIRLAAERARRAAGL